MFNKNEQISYTRDQLKHAGYRLTYQRFQIIDVIYENNRHMNVEEIYSKVKSKNVGLSTIYRNLLILEEVGILRRITLPNTSYYELEGIGEYKFHIHAKCDKCNKIIDVNEEETSENFCSLIEKLKKNHIISIKSTSVVLSGICKECEIKL